MFDDMLMPMQMRAVAHGRVRGRHEARGAAATTIGIKDQVVKVTDDLESEVYNKGMFKTELCKKLEKTMPVLSVSQYIWLVDST
jgi:hypothetical protein